MQTTEAKMAGDKLLVSVVDVKISKVLSVANSQLNSSAGFQEALRRFCMALRGIRDMLHDAEQKHMMEKDAVKDWLKDLRRLADDADYLVDKISYEDERLKIAAQKKMFKKVSNFFSPSNPLAFRIKMANKMANLNVALADLDRRASNLILQTINVERDPEQRGLMQQTVSFLGDTSTVMGRDEDLQNILCLLMDSSNDQPLLVVPIVGMAGVGKTTLARLISNHYQIRLYFSKIIWVCVSDDFDVSRILKEMLESLTNSGAKDITNLDAITLKLKTELRHNNFLLVLDDVWNRDRRKWGDLRRCLLLGPGHGSSVVVTTRDLDVATMIASSPKYIRRLEPLKFDECWSIIKQRAVGNSPLSSELEKIGWEIATNCGGLPLVAEVLGEELCNKWNREDWLSIKNSSALCNYKSVIFQDLMLSFDHLPTHVLKQCFAFCSIFPKGFAMDKEMLIQLWMAQGFLHSSDSSMGMEDIGDRYFKDLVSYCFFENVVGDSYGSIITCKMHDFVHDLAQSVSKPEMLILEGGSWMDISDIRYLKLICAPNLAPVKMKHISQKLHSLFSEVDVSCDIPVNFKRLLVLSFRGANIDKLPSFLGKLKRLRYLDISETRMKKIPKFVSKLYLLQTLRFMDCYSMEMPVEGMGNLVNLRHIYFNDKEHMPAGIGRLTCLRTLQLFVVGRLKGRRIEELGCLNHLRGKLEICSLWNVRDKAEAMRAKLDEKTAICELILDFGLEYGSEERCELDEDVLEGLQPHSNVKSLTVSYYCGKMCPSWMSESTGNLDKSAFLQNIVTLVFKRCGSLKSIPSHSLPNLLQLSIFQCDQLKSISPLSLNNEAKLEIEGCKNLSSVEVSSLQKLFITDCDELITLEVVFAVKSLKELYIERCGKLASLPMIGKLEALEILHLKRCWNLTEIGDSMHGLSYLQEIDISSCGQLKSIGESLSTSCYLKKLTMEKCPSLIFVPSLHGLYNLETLSLESCDGLIHPPSGLSSCTSLWRLTIKECHSLISIPEDLGKLCSLVELDFSRCRKLRSLPGDRYVILAGLKKLCIGGFSEELEEFSFPSFMAHLPASLENLTLIGWENLKHLPHQIQQLTALRELRIEDFDGLEALPEWFGDLVSLQRLSISKCKCLKQMPSVEAMRCLSKLENLEIWGCPELGMKCDHGSGSEWRKISYIPKIKIDWHMISTQDSR